jgi:hypothetical protein
MLTNSNNTGASSSDSEERVYAIANNVISNLFPEDVQVETIGILLFILVSFVTVAGVHKNDMDQTFGPELYEIVRDYAKSVRSKSLFEECKANLRKILSLEENDSYSIGTYFRLVFENNVRANESLVHNPSNMLRGVLRLADDVGNIFILNNDSFKIPLTCEMMASAISESGWTLSLDDMLKHSQLIANLFEMNIEKLKVMQLTAGRESQKDAKLTTPPILFIVMENVSDINAWQAFLANGGTNTLPLYCVDHSGVDDSVEEGSGADENDGDERSTNTSESPPGRLVYTLLAALYQNLEDSNKCCAVIRCVANDNMDSNGTVIEQESYIQCDNQTGDVKVLPPDTVLPNRSRTFGSLLFAWYISAKCITYEESEQDFTCHLSATEDFVTSIIKGRQRGDETDGFERGSREDDNYCSMGCIADNVESVFKAIHEIRDRTLVADIHNNPI